MLAKIQLNPNNNVQNQILNQTKIDNNKIQMLEHHHVKEIERIQ